MSTYRPEYEQYPLDEEDYFSLKTTPITIPSDFPINYVYLSSERDFDSRNVAVHTISFELNTFGHCGSYRLSYVRGVNKNHLVFRWGMSGRILGRTVAMSLGVSPIVDRDICLELPANVFKVEADKDLHGTVRIYELLGEHREKLFGSL